MTAKEKITFKARKNPPKLGMSVNGIYATAITVDTVADDYVEKTQLDTGFITFKLAAFAQPLDGDEVDIFAAIKGQPLEMIMSAVLLGPVATRPDPFLIKVDKALLPDLPQPATATAYDVQVLVYKDGAGTDDPSNILTVVIDENPPYGLKFPTKRLTVPTPNATFTNAPADAQRTVNETWMSNAANADLQLVFGVAYANRRLDDTLELHLVSGVAPNTVDTIVFNGVVPASGAISIPNTELRKHRNGRVMAHFFWTDHVGNKSLSSTSTALLTLGLALDPVLRKAPLVPATDPNATTTIYLDNFLKADGTEGPISAIVERAFIDNLEPGDQVQVYIEDALDPTNFKMLGPVPITSADVTFQLAYTALFKDLFGTYEEASEFKIWAEVVRGTSTFPSPELFFWVDLYPAGGLYPELPETVNPNFASPVTTGFSQIPNDVQPGDRDKEGKIEVTLALTDPPLNSTETAKFYLDGKYVNEVSPFSDMTEFSVTVPAITMGALPTPTVKAHWTRQKTGIDKNVISSPSQDVKVSGRKIDLLQPTIRIRNADKQQCDCYAMINAATTATWRLLLGIPKDSVNLPVGTVITVYMEAHSNATATALIAGTEDNQPYTIQAAGTADLASLGNAAIFKLAQPVRGATAWIKLWYTANIGGVQKSVELITKLDTITSSAEYCDRESVPIR